MEEAFADTSRWVASAIEAGAVLVVTYGAVEAFGRLLALVAKPPVVFAARKTVWRRFGSWLPTWAEIGQLASIAVIRTFLNYFLEQDLERAGLPEEA
jgi:uncharacterized membrane protein